NRSEDDDEGVRMKSEYFAECYVHDAATGKEVRQWRVTGGTGNEIEAAAVSPDGKTLALAIKDRVRLYDVGAGEELRRMPEDPGEGGALLRSLAFSPDSKRLAVGGYRTQSGIGAVLSVYSVADGKCLARRKEDDHSFGCLAYSPDGKDLATADGQHVAVRDAATLKDRTP